MKRLSSVWLFACAGFVMVAAALPCLADQIAVLTNGFTIQHTRRAVVGELTRLYVSADGASYVDVPTAEIDHYEEAPPAPTPPANQGETATPGFPARPRTDLDQVVSAASDRYRLDPDLVNSVIKAESGFNVRAVSPKGAQGLMQLMPSTAAQLGVPNAFDPQANVEGGTKYLRELLERYDFDLIKALAAYNAGPQRVEQFGGVPPFYETRAYVARVVKDFNKKKIAQGKTASDSSSQKMASSGSDATNKSASAKAGAPATKTRRPASAKTAKANPPPQ